MISSIDVSIVSMPMRVEEALIASDQGDGSGTVLCGCVILPGSCQPNRITWEVMHIIIAMPCRSRSPVSFHAHEEVLIYWNEQYVLIND